MIFIVFMKKRIPLVNAIAGWMRLGTPFCVTVDHQTKEDQTVTIRYRDTMEQETNSNFLYSGIGKAKDQVKIYAYFFCSLMNRLPTCSFR